jgi:hypothetical protein
LFSAGARIAAVGLLALALGAQGARAERCVPWPGEPKPLPQMDAEDDLLARWAVLRAAELAQAARELETSHPARAHRLWQRVLCIDPTNEEATAGIGRVPLVRLHRPSLRRGRPETPPGDAFASLGVELAVAVPQPDPKVAARRAVAEALANSAEYLKNARFEEALASAAEGRAAVGRLGAAADASQTAELETLAATAAIALGREAEARRSFARALDAEPGLTLDPARTSPKVRRAFDAVREQRGLP